MVELLGALTKTRFQTEATFRFGLPLYSMAYPVMPEVLLGGVQLTRVLPRLLVTAIARG